MPQVDSVPVVVKKGKLPEPSASTTSIKKFELLHRPFDLKFRGKVSSWLEGFETDSITLANIIDPEQIQLLELYFMPQRKRWLSQRQVCRKLKRKSTRRLSADLRSILLSIWGKTH